MQRYVDPVSMVEVFVSPDREEIEFERTRFLSDPLRYSVSEPYQVDGIGGPLWALQVIARYHMGPAMH